MITAVSLNPSIDRTMKIRQLKIGGLNRAISQVDVAAGKGVNVALAASALGAEAECIGFMYREGASHFERRLGDAGVNSDFVYAGGSVRINTKVLDMSRGEITEFNTSGVPVTEEQIDLMNDLMKRHAKNTDIVVLSGSLPPGCPADFYKTLSQSVKENGARVILDADGERLRYGIDAKPFMIKPNRYELEQLTGHILSSVNEVLDAAIACVNRGVSVVVVSLGNEGALITDGEQAWRAKAKVIEVKSTVAAGDSMIAALACAFSKEYDLEKALRMGVATATVRCITDPDKMIDRTECQKMFDSIETEKIL